MLTDLPLNANVLQVGSDGHKDVRYLDYSSKNAWNHKFRWSLLPTMSRYKYSKLAVHLWTNDLVLRLSTEKSKVMVLIAHPGAILSDSAIRSLKTAVSTFLDMAVRSENAFSDSWSLYVRLCSVHTARQP
ncbi:uncharacterized protein BT62DRAFT_231619 [Guyanagaster necrorhizus]|uniref:Uncharacterized protein n=1 Tax=Guyanagaster necrorhizus TaxID=856835 RepID=A0A9P7VQJ2_9AGAR|nr:uncharacterized protein BT62DRAFT_231619 [Guyanagaster necrorhizus MCA 3950]KAG7444865.1 hypothetical protein BT62DRAFT_231619 [Guyanagaster necrorhizus MCA 3950]